MSTRVSQVTAIIFVMSLLVAAGGCAKPKVQLQVSRDRIQQGEDVRVSWTAKNAKAVTLNNETVDAKAGSRVFAPDNTTTYTAVATRGKKEARDSKVVDVSPRPPRPSISISSDQDAIIRGQSTTLRWNSSNADRVNISELGAVPSSGSRVISPSDSTTYTATAEGPGGTDSASTRVSVSEDTSSSGSRPRVAAPNPAIATIFSERVRAIFFEYDQSELRDDAKETLRRAAVWLTQAPNRSIAFRIEGNCDPRGTEEYNIGLGERRAQAAREFLVSLGVEPSRIHTVSYGEEKALGSHEGGPHIVPSWAHDRRDEFVYISGGTDPGSSQ